MLISRASMSPFCRATGPARSGLTLPLQLACPRFQSKLVSTELRLTSIRDTSLLDSGRSTPPCSSNTVFWLMSISELLMVSAYSQRLLPCEAMVILPLPCMPMALAWYSALKGSTATALAPAVASSTAVTSAAALGRLRMFMVIGLPGIRPVADRWCRRRSRAVGRARRRGWWGTSSSGTIPGGEIAGQI